MDALETLKGMTSPVIPTAYGCTNGFLQVNRLEQISSFVPLMRMESSAVDWFDGRETNFVMVLLT